jgi:HemK-like putative methylase
MSSSITIVSNPAGLLEKSLAHTGEYLVDVNGISLWVHPEVLSPKYSYSSRFVIEHWDIAPGMKVLDMGTGSGVLAIHAALLGATHVIATDINPYAIAVTRKNSVHHHLEHRVHTIHSDVFSAVPKDERFDRIIFNAPYWNKRADPSHPLSAALYDEEYRVLRIFFEQATQYLAPGGIILLAFSTQGDVGIVEEAIEKNHFFIKALHKETKGHTRLLYFISTLL